MTKHDILIANIEALKFLTMILLYIKPEEEKR